ncbi:MAG: aspartate/glutamate racemase family protein [Psychroserpens sp.]|nr:aspartate/glutamate racemase family protein [Psychroserpens sp.]
MAKQLNRLCVLGIGERSTSYYISALHSKYHEQLGDFHTFPFLMYQIDFNRINPFLPNKFDQLIPEMTTVLKSISNFKASQYLIPNITLHETLDKIDHHLNIIHPVHLTIKYCKTHHMDTVVLLGSQYTMSSNYISDALKAEGIDTIKPSVKEQLKIDEFRTKTYNNKDTKLDFRRYNQLIQTYTKSFPVITACTELSLHHNKLNNSKVIDMALLQIKTAITLLV